MKFGIGKRLIFLGWGMVLALGGVVGIYIIQQLNHTMEHEMQERGELLADFVAHESSYHMIIGDREGITRLVQKTWAQDDIVFCRVEDKNGDLTYEKGVKRGPFKEFSAPVIISKPAEEASEAMFFEPAEEAKKEIGRVYVGMSLENMQSKLVRLQRLIVTIIVAAILFVFIITYFAIHHLLGRRVSQLVQATRRIATGDLSHQIRIRGEDELSILAESFNEMTDSLQKTTVSRDYMDAIFRHMMDSLLVTDSEGNIKTVNRAACNILGYREEELIGKKIDLVLPESTLEESGELDLSLADSPNNIESFFLTSNGDRIPVLLSVSVMRRGRLQKETGPVIPGRKKENIAGIIYVALDISEQKELLEQLKIISITDELTGLLNRRGFITMAEQQLRLAQRSGDRLLLLFGDLDNMKSVNDNLGHATGDQALVEIANLLVETFRESDVIGRIGGDEFAMLLNLRDDEISEKAAVKRLERRLENLNSQRDRNYILLLSLGSVWFNPEHPQTLEELMVQADSKMYEMKKKKKNADPFSPLPSAPPLSNR